eukprot:Nitzschia sp. Nitz4//scaffold30_size153850//111538//112185//NITZ4_002789-RA/size153850-snap-gene-0.103-mRNA-1//-1//CDS//3329547297//7842//frame0
MVCSIPYNGSPGSKPGKTSWLFGKGIDFIYFQKSHQNGSNSFFDMHPLMIKKSRVEQGLTHLGGMNMGNRFSLDAIPKTGTSTLESVIEQNIDTNGRIIRVVDQKTLEFPKHAPR